jgi:hypothetical protein
MRQGNASVLAGFCCPTEKKNNPMPAKLSIDAIRARATKFAKQFEGVTSEKQQDQNFMRGFCHVFGINPDRMRWQFKLKDGKTTTWADGVLPGMALFEIKSAGEGLDEAYEQAARYIQKMQDADVPQLVIVSDFARIHVYRGASRVEFTLAELPQQVDHLTLLAGYEAVAIKRQNEVNEAAAEKIGKLHDVMKANGYRGKDLETYLVRLLFCLFADDTGLFGERDRFLGLIRNTKPDGSDLHGELEVLFSTLNRDLPDRAPNLPERFKGFPYVNGDLFAGRLEDPYCFDEDSRSLLVELAEDNWSDIDPSIFGSLFQAIMHHDDEQAGGKAKKRRELGAHYTSEQNILKAIGPLFLDELRSEFEKIKRNRAALGAFHERLAKLQIMDPACGCGNFLVVSYRELRLLELEVIEALHGGKQNISDVALLVRLDVDQFHGIEIDSTAARIATVALWLTDHQMNMRLQRLGVYMHRLPLRKRPNIVCGNALRVDWADVLSPDRCSFIVGNPPFRGKQYQSPEQKDDLAVVFAGVKGAGVLDYVAGWHRKATDYMAKNPMVRTALVSTNSITQGEQVGILWADLFMRGIKIYFAHRTFQWSNEGRGVAAVHCIIIGFGRCDSKEKVIFEYETLQSDPAKIKVSNINPYLVDAADIALERRSSPVSDVPCMVYGSKPADGGSLLLTPEEKEELIELEPKSAKWIRRMIGSEEFINGIERYCLWLKDCPPDELRSMPLVLKRVEAVKKMRLASPKKPTQLLADTPTLFAEIRQPETDYLVMPEVSSERRMYIPIGFLPSATVASNLVYVIPHATLYHFGVVTSRMHMAWVRSVCGRLKSDYRYSTGIVYNNFPWPSEGEQRASVEKAAQAVLDARARFPAATLADLYGPLTMPPELLKAHQALDRAVDAAYAKDGYDKRKTSDADRVAFLFERYQRLTSFLPAKLLPPRRTRSRKVATKEAV